MSEEDFYKQNTLPGPEAKAVEQQHFSVPDAVGPYKIESLLETGGMSSVYLGTDPNSQKTVTIKTLLPKFLNNQEVVKRFMNEAEIISKTDHKNVVSLYGHGKWEGGMYIALEFIEGQSLRQHIQQTPISLKRALEMILEISYALCHLHTHGIIHRDLKLENILVTKEGNIKVIDFGIAQLLSEQDGKAPQYRIIGTPIYMSPEQRDNPESVSYPSDIYSLGIIAYELILGKLSHGKIHLSLMPKGLQKILSKALQPNPSDRYQDVVDFISAISDYMNSAMLEKEKKNSDHLGETVDNIEKSLSALLPSSPPDWPNCECAFVCYQNPKSSRIFYDFIELNDGSYGVLMGHPSDKTAESMLYIGLIKGLIKGVLSSIENENLFLETLSRALREMSLDTYIPFAYLRFDPNKNKFWYTSCDFGALWLIAKDSEKPTRPESENKPLGSESGSLSTFEGEWLPGDQLLFSSHAKSSEAVEEDFGITFLQERSSPCSKQIDQILRKVKLTAKHWIATHPLALFAVKLNGE